VTVLTLFLGFAETTPTANLALLGLYILIGAGFSLTLGLFFGSIFQTSSAANAVAGVSPFLFILPAVFVPLAPLVGANSAVLQLLKALPTYYIADGVYNALLNQGSFSSQLLDVAVVVGSMVVIALLATGLLRRQSAVAVAI
jgi:ABC-2 type transport system permease protein